MVIVPEVLFYYIPSVIATLVWNNVVGFTQWSDSIAKNRLDVGWRVRFSLLPFSVFSSMPINKLRLIASVDFVED